MAAGGFGCGAPVAPGKALSVTLTFAGGGAGADGLTGGFASSGGGCGGGIAGVLPRLPVQAIVSTANRYLPLAVFALIWMR